MTSTCLNDLLLSIDDTEICSYANDTTIYTYDQNLEIATMRLKNSFFKRKEGKCHVFVLGASHDESSRYYICTE